MLPEPIFTARSYWPARPIPVGMHFFFSNWSHFFDLLGQSPRPPRRGRDTGLVERSSAFSLHYERLRPLPRCFSSVFLPVDAMLVREPLPHLSFLYVTGFILLDSQTCPPLRQPPRPVSLCSTPHPELRLDLSDRLRFPWVDVNCDGPLEF